MTSLPTLETPQNESRQGALAGVRILDLTDERGIYGAKILADLGADVVRVEPPSGDVLRRRGPLDERTGASLWHAFFASNRRFVEINVEVQADCALLNELAAKSAIVLTCRGGSATHDFAGALDLETAQAQHPDLVVVDTTSFGTHGPWSDYLAPDLIAGALGGVVATTGDVDTPPLKAYGELNFMVSGAYVAIAALSALFNVREGGEGQQVDVSVHECLVSCLEQVLMFYWYGEAMGRPEGKVLPRRGALHWSNAYTVFNGKNGSIMVTPAPDFDKQLVWLVEEGVHDDLIDPKYSEPENLGLLIERTMQIMRDWVATKNVDELFEEAQARHAPFGWVLPIERVGDNPQLAARDWFVNYRVAGQEVSGPGAPYHFSATPWRIHESVESEAQAVLNDIGWSDSA